MKAIIIDDETMPRQHLISLLKRNFPRVKVAGEAADAASAAKLIDKIKPDLLFLDVEMPGRSGLEMLAELPSVSFAIIFVTGHNQYALDAIRMSALDYLLKPVQLSALGAAILKAEKQLKYWQDSEQLAMLQTNLTAGRLQPRIIALPLTDKTRIVEMDDIVRCETMNNYTMFILVNKEKLLISKGLYEFEAALQSNGFLRCHHSHMVNLRHIKSVLRSSSTWELEMEGGGLVPVSRSRRGELRNRLLQG